MKQEEIKSLFDQQASGYDQQWARMAPIRDGLHFLLRSVFADLPENARLLCVGAGTGVEMAYLARTFPRWTFTAVDPSGAMLDICRQRADAEGYAARCTYHEGYVDSLPAGERHDAATSLLVSQFILDQQDRIEFFRTIAARLKPGGILVSADLASDIHSEEYSALLRCWFNVMASAGIPREGLDRMREAYARDVAVLPPLQVASLLTSAGFRHPVQFFQSGLMHAWFSTVAQS